MKNNISIVHSLSNTIKLWNFNIWYLSIFKNSKNQILNNSAIQK